MREFIISVSSSILSTLPPNDISSKEEMYTNSNSLSPECIIDSEAWTSCLLENSQCLSNIECEEQQQQPDDDEFKCHLIPELCRTVSCCEDCYQTGLDLIHCEAEVRNCPIINNNNECPVTSTTTTAASPILDNNNNVALSELSRTPPDVDVSSYPLNPDFRCGTNENDAKDNCGKLCDHEIDCPSGLVCWGTWNSCYVYELYDDYASSSESNSEDESSPPTLEAESDYRCGITEADARSNCKKKCMVNTDCEGAGEYCWTTHINYCYLMPENHPQCPHDEAEQVYMRCGIDEMAARGYCGKQCTTQSDCTQKDENCFAVHLNMCQCFEEQDMLDRIIPNNDNFRRHRRNLKEDNTIISTAVEHYRNQTHHRDLNSILEDVFHETNRQYFDRAIKLIVWKYDNKSTSAITSNEDNNNNFNNEDTSSSKKDNNELNTSVHSAAAETGNNYYVMVGLILMISSNLSLLISFLSI